MHQVLLVPAQALIQYPVWPVVHRPADVVHMDPYSRCQPWQNLEEHPVDVAASPNAVRPVIEKDVAGASDSNRANRRAGAGLAGCPSPDVARPLAVAGARVRVDERHLGWFVIPIERSTQEEARPVPFPLPPPALAAGHAPGRSTTHASNPLNGPPPQTNSRGCLRARRATSFSSSA